MGSPAWLERPAVVLGQIFIRCCLCPVCFHFGLEASVHVDCRSLLVVVMAAADCRFCGVCRLVATGGISRGW